MSAQPRKRKRGPGRPPLGRQTITTRLSPQVVKALDWLVERYCLADRTSVLERLILADEMRLRGENVPQRPPPEVQI